MHLFIIDIFISIDVLSPLAEKLCKEEKKIFFFNSNFIQNHNSSNNKLIKFLETNKNFKLINNFNLLNIRFILFRFFSKIIIFFFKIFKKKGYKIWKFLWLQDLPLSNLFLFYLIKKYKIKSITVVEDLPDKKFFFFKNVAAKAKIPLIMIPSGLSPVPGSIDLSKKIPDHFLSSNLLNNDKINKNSFFRLLGSPRYAPTWIENLKQIYNLDKKKNFTVGIFTKATESTLLEFYKIKNKLLDKRINVLLNSKPREILPLKNTIQFKELSSTEIIEYSDVIISYPSSILLEAIQKQKPIIFPFYSEFMKEKKGGFFDDNDLFFFPKNIDELIELIITFKEKKKSFKYNEIKKNIFLKSTINLEDKNNILNNFNKFYSELE